jgi:transposase
VVGHDVRVLARKTVRVKALRLGEALAQAWAKGFAQVTVACEPTGPRWLRVQRLCAGRAVPLVCIQPLMSHIARGQQDLTMRKADESGWVLVSRLAVELHCCIPEELDETGAHLRRLGRRRSQLITVAAASAQRIAGFLSVAWAAVTEACAGPLESLTWLTTVQAVTSRCGAGPALVADTGAEACIALVRAGVGNGAARRPTARSSPEFSPR